MCNRNYVSERYNEYEWKSQSFVVRGREKVCVGDLNLVPKLKPCESFQYN
jgi:hypothetical protein